MRAIVAVIVLAVLGDISKAATPATQPATTQTTISALQGHWKGETPEQVQDDYKRLCAIFQKTTTDSGHVPEAVTAEERAYVIATLERRTGLWFAHDFPRMAAITVGNLKAQETAPRLIELLSLKLRNYDMVSAEAARALGKIGDPETLPHLFHALHDERAMVRWHASEAILAIGVQPKTMEPFRTDETFKEIVTLLGQLPFVADGMAQKEPSIDRSPFSWMDFNALCVVAMLVRPATPSMENVKLAAATMDKIHPAYLSGDSHMKQFATWVAEEKQRQKPKE